MTPESDPLRQLLASYESAGQHSSEGSFTLDPQRAVEILRGQGRLGQNAPLYLLSAIWQHTGGEPVEREHGQWSWRLSWQPSIGPLRPQSVHIVLAQESFASLGIQLALEANAVTLRPVSSHLRPRAASLLQPIFQSVEDRLTFYPWQDNPTPVSAELLAQSSDYQLFAAREKWGRFHQVVRGIAYARRWTLPVDAVCWDTAGQPDLTLSVIPDSVRNASLERAAEDLFLKALRDSLTSAPVSLKTGADSTALPLFARYLGYAAKQTLDPDLARRAAEGVRFPDATGGDWSARELLEVEQLEGRLLMVPEPSSETIDRARSDRPVLLWNGQAEQVGETLFQTLTSGAGYLYSLEVNEQERQRVTSHGETRLASKRVEGGRLSLLPWGDPDRTAEVEFVGPRRSRQTFYLEEDAPKSLRLIWESDHELEESLRQLSLERPLRQAVLELIDASLHDGSPPRQTLLEALSWGLARGDLDWAGLERLNRAPLFYDVSDSLVSLQQLRQWQNRSGALPVLIDRSSSLPRVLPVQPLVWFDPLFHLLGLEVEDHGRAVRQAHWQQEGQERWLRQAPTDPAWPRPVGQEMLFPPHRVARKLQAEELSEVFFWKEGRSFGSRTLQPDECPAGWALLWIDDDLPGDAYWSGPQAEAVSLLLPRIAKLAKKAETALPLPGENGLR